MKPKEDKYKGNHTYPYYSKWLQAKVNRNLKGPQSWEWGRDTLQTGKQESKWPTSQWKTEDNGNHHYYSENAKLNQKF